MVSHGALSDRENILIGSKDVPHLKSSVLHMTSPDGKRMTEKELAFLPRKLKTYAKIASETSKAHLEAVNLVEHHSNRLHLEQISKVVESEKFEEEVDATKLGEKMIKEVE